MAKIYGYIRVSTKGQMDGNSFDQQIAEITNIYNNATIYEEQFSAKTKNRPIFTELLELLDKGDLLVITKLDRFARNTADGIETIEMLMQRGVRIHILNMGLIEDSYMGKLIYTILLAFAEYERAMIIERTTTGKAIAKTKEGYKEGRPNKFTQKTIDLALSQLTVNGGVYSYKEVEERMGISKSTLIRENNKRKIKTDNN